MMPIMASFPWIDSGQCMIASVGKIRETIVVALVAIFVATAVYTVLGFAWTFKSAFETAQRLKHPFSRGY